MVDAWLSLPLPALILALIGCFATSALLLIGVSFGPVIGPWVQSFRGVVGPFFGAIVLIFGILVGFLATDVWDRSRRAAATVRAEGAYLVSLHDLVAANGLSGDEIDDAIRAYVIAVVSKEWQSMEDGNASAEAETAQDQLLKTIAQSEWRSGEFGRLLLDTAMKVREARAERLALSSDYSESAKWMCVLLMALMAQISLAAVHLDAIRPQIAALFIYTTSVLIVLNLIAIHEAPFQPPLAVSPAPLAALLDIIPAR